MLVLCAGDLLEPVARAQRLGVELALKRDWQQAIDCFAERVARTLAVKVRAFAARYRLTPRQKEVLGYYVDDHEIEEIADRLGISVRTVETHLKQVLARTRAGRLSEIRRRVRRWPASRTFSHRRSRARDHGEPGAART